MQTFMTASDFRQTARELDYRRLGKQRVEAKQILMCLLGEGCERWANHPAVKMWRGYESVLAWYGLTMCQEWVKRGYKDNLGPYFLKRISSKPVPNPEWSTDAAFLSSHRACLLAKNYEHYSQFGWTETPAPVPGKKEKWAYVWPTSSASL